MNIADETLTDYSLLSRYHYTKSKNYIKDDIEFVTEFPCLLRHPLFQRMEELETVLRIKGSINVQRPKIKAKDDLRHNLLFHNFQFFKPLSPDIYFHSTRT